MTVASAIALLPGTCWTCEAPVAIGDKCAFYRGQVLCQVCGEHKRAEWLIYGCDLADEPPPTEACHWSLCTHGVNCVHAAKVDDGRRSP